MSMRELEQVVDRMLEQDTADIDFGVPAATWDTLSSPPARAHEILIPYDMLKSEVRSDLEQEGLYALEVIFNEQRDAHGVGFGGEEIAFVAGRGKTVEIADDPSKDHLRVFARQESDEDWSVDWMDQPEKLAELPVKAYELIRKLVPAGTKLEVVL